MTHVTGFGVSGELGHLKGATGWTQVRRFLRHLAADGEVLSSTAGSDPGPGPEVARRGLSVLGRSMQVFAGAKVRSGSSTRQWSCPPHPDERVAVDIGQDDCAIRRGLKKTRVGGLRSQDGQLLPDVPATVGCT
jgi:hypothetical protein